MRSLENTLHGENHPFWKGGTWTRNGGRVYMCGSSHPFKRTHKCFSQACFVAMVVFGRELPVGTIVHHANGDPSNDSNNNLVLCENRAYHNLLHQRKRAYDECGDTKKRACQLCKQYDFIDNLYVSPDGNTIRHRRCHANYEFKRKQPVYDDLTLTKG